MTILQDFIPLCNGKKDIFCQIKLERNPLKILLLDIQDNLSDTLPGLNRCSKKKKINMAVKFQLNDIMEIVKVRNNTTEIKHNRQTYYYDYNTTTTVFENGEHCTVIIIEK